MPAVPNRRQLQTEELAEFPITGPFGGIQSELPLDQIENYGFYDSLNYLFRLGTAQLRPGYTPLTPFPAPANEPVLGIADFFNVNGVRIQCVMTVTRLLQWNAGTQSWSTITGPAFTGSVNQVFTWDVVGNKLCFSQGANQILIWDGIAGSYTLSSASAPAANYLAEIGLHMVAANTIESGVNYTQRYRWSGIGDPTDWTSFSSGINDNLNNLGPIYGLKKLGQFGYGWHVWGILSIQPTGIGALPFIFAPVANSNVGNFLPRTLDHFNQNGVECAAYTGWDNVYVFNQSSVIPIGDAPIDGRRRIGARSRIIADLINGGNSQNSYGYVTQNIKGNVYNAYWLIIPGVSTWIYNFDEGNWTRITYTNTQTIAGRFLDNTQTTIGQLLGSIGNLTGVIGQLSENVPYDGFALGFQNGTVGFVDFSQPSEQPGTITSGFHLFNDRRHKKTVKKFRLVIQDVGATTYTISLQNNQGQTLTQVINVGTGSGNTISQVIEFNISGLWIQWSVSAPALTRSSIIEFAPIYDTSGEQRGGTID